MCFELLNVNLYELVISGFFKEYFTFDFVDQFMYSASVIPLVISLIPVKHFTFAAKRATLCRHRNGDLFMCEGSMFLQENSPCVSLVFIQKITVIEFTALLEVAE